ncbi:hypothetical protein METBISCDRAFT_26504 [Metschnikowia bicuspidata]|uniref:Putative lipoate-protein ligase A n=1 Tax=Metschnikowia bicuspidata TaxID=27322 RepID=A0A4P9ZHU0_9ASCO|nr:hypothetical protein METBISCDRAFT_26504 [Metschnikowia bicuspidata]
MYSSLAPKILRGCFPGFSKRLLLRRSHNVPFQDDLTPLDDDLFNLQDFQHYREAPDVLALKKKLGLEDSSYERKTLINTHTAPEQPRTFEDYCTAKEPVVFVLKIQNPYLNLAVEDYIYNAMAVPEKGAPNCNRLLFYVNSPCVVIGKNQNPWKEVNLPLLTNLRLPLVRRRSGGGTVVHDTGNVNYSFMTTRDKFDRFAFTRLVADAVNTVAVPEKHVIVNDRGDIVIKNGAEKVSGSAYKISRGKSYHHGTMLLNLKLSVLRQLLHRDETKFGSVHASSAVASVKSPVTNLEIDTQRFIDALTAKFQDAYGVASRTDSAKAGDIYQTDLLGLGDFVAAFTPKSSLLYVITENGPLPAEIGRTRNELIQWSWRFGATLKFLHTLENARRKVSVRIDVGPKALVTDVHVEGPRDAASAFEFLKQAIKSGRGIPYTGSLVAGYVLDDELSEWIGQAIDGTS